MAVMRMIETIKYVRNEDDVDDEDVSKKRKTNMMEMMMNHKEDDNDDDKVVCCVLYRNCDFSCHLPSGEEREEPRYDRESRRRR